MDKGALHHKWRRVRLVRPAYFVVLFIISAVICLVALRQNYSHMVVLKDKVYAADKSGQGVEPALQNLQNFITHHMNTNPASASNSVYPPIQLKYTYERLQQQALAEQNQGKTNFYTEAQDTCQQQYPIESSLYVWQSYVKCVQAYLASHNASVTAPASGPPAGLYEFDFASPAWSPDLAGWSLVASALFLALAIAFFLVDFWFKRELER